MGKNIEWFFGGEGIEIHPNDVEISDRGVYEIGCYIKPVNGTMRSVDFIEISSDNFDIYHAFNGNGSVKTGYSVITNEAELEKAREYCAVFSNVKKEDFVDGKTYSGKKVKGVISELPKEIIDPAQKPWQRATVKTKDGKDERIWVTDLPKMLVKYNTNGKRK